MSLWLETSPDTHEEERSSQPKQGILDPLWFGLDAAMRSSMHKLDGKHYEAMMRADLRVLAVAGIVPERGYKKIGVFRDAVEVMKDMERLTR